MMGAKCEYRSTIEKLRRPPSSMSSCKLTPLCTALGAHDMTWIVPATGLDLGGPPATEPPNLCHMHVRGTAGMANMRIESRRRHDARQRTCANETTIRGSLVRGPGGY